MLIHRLGSTGIEISAVSFGAGPVPALMTAENPDAQMETLQRAVSLGVNWIDTAATYGGGRSEESLGRALRELKLAGKVQVATKVRLEETDLEDIPAAVEASLEGSLRRLRLDRVTLLQLHNSITARRGDQPTSITPGDVLGRGGVLEALREQCRRGRVRHLGITALGQPEPMREVIRCGEFATIQVPYHLLNPSAGQSMPKDFREADYGDIIGEAARHSMGVLAIRVFAGGALIGQSPSRHTHTTRFFPLDLYERDRRRAELLANTLPENLSLNEAAVRFVLSHPEVSSAIIGFGEPRHVDDAVRWAHEGPLPAALLAQLRSADDGGIPASL